MNIKFKTLTKLVDFKSKIVNFVNKNILGKKVDVKHRTFQDDRDGEDACLFVDEKKENENGDYDGTPYC